MFYRNLRARVRELEAANANIVRCYQTHQLILKRDAVAIPIVHMGSPMRLVYGMFHQHRHYDRDMHPGRLFIGSNCELRYYHPSVAPKCAYIVKGWHEERFMDFRNDVEVDIHGHELKKVEVVATGASPILVKVKKPSKKAKRHAK